MDKNNKSQELSEEYTLELFQSKQGFLLRIAAKYVPAPDMTYDVLQDVYIEFARFVAERNEECTEDKIDAILTNMCKSRAIDYWRKHRNHEKMAVRIIEEYFLNHLASETPGENESDQAKLDALKKCIEILPKRKRLLIQMRYIEKHSMRDIALLSGTKFDTIRKTYTRIRQVLARCIRKTLDGMRLDKGKT